MDLPWHKPYDFHKPTSHVIFVHTKCGLREKDYYLASIVFALLQMSKLVTIYTAEVDPLSPLNNIEGATNKLKFIRTWARLPTIPLTTLNGFIKHIQMFGLVCQVMLRPPSPIPSVIITDTHTWALTFLKTFTSYRVIHIHHFPLIYTGNLLHPLPNAHFKRSTTRALRKADEIVVQTECLKKVMERSLSDLASKITVLNPCYDIGPWMNAPLNVRSVLPMLPDDFILFAAFGKYKPRSNFEALLEAFRYFTYYIDRTIVLRTRVVIVGYQDSLSNLELIYFNELVTKANELPYKSNIIFLKNSNIVQQISIINNSSAILNPMNQSAHPGTILVAMNLNVPIVSADNGFAAEVLENGISGFLIDKMVDNKPAMFARMMAEIVKNPRLGELLAESAKSKFDEKYSYFTYRQLVDSMITRQMNYKE